MHRSQMSVLMPASRWSLFLLLLSYPYACVQAKSYSYAPSSRLIHPIGVLRTTGSARPRTDLSNTAFSLSGPNASVTYDFGQETAGFPTVQYFDASCGGLSCGVASLGLPSLTCSGICQGVGLSYSESAAFAGIGSDRSTFFTTDDGVVYLPIRVNDSYVVPTKWARGGFRFLTLSLGPNTPQSTSVTLAIENLYYTAAPNLNATQLGQYTGHFDSSDELLNQIWYAGVHTLQLNTIPANSSVNHLYVVNGGGWAQDSTATGLNGNAVYLADGAKRDRNPWAGDQSIALRTALTAQNFDSVVAVRNALIECLILQDTNPLSVTYGYFPYAGSPLGDLLRLVPTLIDPYGSDTYHIWTIDVFAEYILVTKDTQLLNKYDAQVATGIEATYPFIGSDGLFNGTRNADWGRVGQGGKNAALNALYYDALQKMVRLAAAFPSSPAFKQGPARWKTMASTLKQSFNAQLWDEPAGLFKDNTTAAGARVHPQDGNAFAIEFNLTSTPQQSQTIAQKLAARLTRFGAPSVELPASVSPFIGSHELISQFAVAERSGDPAPALNLIRTQWGYMRQAFSNSSFVEGYGADGGLTYGFYKDNPSFVSHAHSWSTGPVYSLMHDVVGIAATELDVEPAEGQWRIKPVGALSASLQWAKGGVSLPRGAFEVSWNKTKAGALDMDITTPCGQRGTVYVPLLKGKADPKINVNGFEVAYEISGPFAKLGNVNGGKVRVQVS